MRRLRSAGGTHSPGHPARRHASAWPPGLAAELTSSATRARTRAHSRGGRGTDRPLSAVFLLSAKGGFFAGLIFTVKCQTAGYRTRGYASVPTLWYFEVDLNGV